MNIQRCPKCGGRYYGSPEYTADYLCTCIVSTKETTLMGWECPRCGKIYSPFVRECNCPPPSTSSTTYKE